MHSPTAAASGAATATTTKTSRSRQVIIALLLLVLAVQLYILHVWMRTDSSGGASATSPRLFTVVTRNSPPAVCLDGLSSSSPPTLDNARTALAVLKQFVDSAPSAEELAALRAPPPDPNEVIISKIGARDAPVLSRHHGAAGHKPSVGDVVHHHDLGEKKHSAQYLEKHATLYSRLRLNFSNSWAADQLDPLRHHGMSAADQTRRDLCLGWFHKHDVLVEAGWGTLPKEHHAEFDKQGCSEIISEFQVANFIVNNTQLYDRVWAVDPKRSIPRPDAPLTLKDTIAIIVSMTTRGIEIKKSIIEELVLFKTLLPSLVDTVEPGFEYWFYLGQSE